MSQLLENLRSRLINAVDLVQALDRLTQEKFMELLSPRQCGAIQKISNSTQANLNSGRKSIVLDSDGTGFLSFSTGNAEHDEALLQTLRTCKRVFPGGGLRGELPQELAYSYRVADCMKKVWDRLSAHGVDIVIISGRKAEQLKNIYAPSGIVPNNIHLYASKGRATIQANGGEVLSSSLNNLLETNPLSTVAYEMVKNVANIVGVSISSDRAEVLGREYQFEFEKKTGYRVSVQEADGKVVLIRLHHRYKACNLAQQFGADISNLDSPGQVQGEEVSTWLNSSAAGSQVLRQLESEDRLIQVAWNRLNQSTLEMLKLAKSDHVGHRSLCQDFAPTISSDLLLEEIRKSHGDILIYGGDNYKLGGNDRPFFDSLHETEPNAALVAVHHSLCQPPNDYEDWMVPADQFELFMMQYALLRQLEAK